MEWLNYHHLFYFWVVARTGSIARACKELRLTQPTISGQLQKLELTIGAPLFVREGRGLRLTDTGRLVFRYSEEIFSTGREMMEVVRGQRGAKKLRLVIGIADVIPKLVAYRLLSALGDLAEPVVPVCREDKTEKLLALLALHEVDVVLTDTGLPPNVRVRGYSHLLGECGVVFCAAPELQKRLNDRHRRVSALVPDSELLRDAPMLMPAEGSQIRQSLEHWLRDHEIQVDIAGEFDDSALLKVFGGAGAGVFAVPDVIEKEVCSQFNVEVIARAPDIRERFYAISAERRIKHPALAAISTSAKRRIFG